MTAATTRRQFLRSAAAASGSALTVPLILPASARGAGGEAAASERITLGLIGMGKMMWGHLGDMLNRQNVQVLAVCDPESLRLETCRQRVDEVYSERFGTTYRGCAAYRDFREVLARPDIDAVFVATPTNWHAVISVAAARAGKDIYCEKPLALTAHEANAIAAAVAQHGVVFQTGSQQRSDFKFRFACELVRNGRIGQLQRVHVNCGGPPTACYLGPEDTPDTLDWDLWLGPAPMRPYHSQLCPMDNYNSWPQWRRYRDYCGGGMFDFGAHHFDIAQWGMGMDGSGPVEILPPDGGDIKHLTYVYSNGVPMTHGGAHGKAAIEFVGSDGTVYVNRGYLATDPPDLMRERWGAGDVRLYESLNHKTNWLDCIRSRRPPICPAEIGCSTLTVCHIGNIAYRLKRPLRWDPVLRHFRDDEAANRLLSRAMRGPWTV